MSKHATMIIAALALSVVAPEIAFSQTIDQDIQNYSNVPGDVTVTSETPITGKKNGVPKTDFTVTLDIPTVIQGTFDEKVKNTAPIWTTLNNDYLRYESSIGPSSAPAPGVDNGLTAMAMVAAASGFLYWHSNRRNRAWLRLPA